MAKKKPVVVITRKLPAPIEARMMELFDARLNAEDERFTREHLLDALKSADVLVTTLADTVDAEAIAKAGKNLKLIANFGVGVDHIDLQACREKGIMVTNTPDVLTDDTADMTMALILAVTRRMHQGIRLVKSGKWAGWAPTLLLGHRITGKRLGIVGMGRIGTAVAKRARCFGMTIHYHNRNRVPLMEEEELEATYWEDLEQMLGHVDVVTVNCPHTPATHHLLNRDRLSNLQSHAYVINTARGPVIDEEALIEMLETQKIAGAGLDVFEQDPPLNERLVKLDNVVLLPHMASATIEGRIKMGEKVLINIKNFVDGHHPPDRVIDADL